MKYDTTVFPWRPLVNHINTLQSIIVHCRTNMHSLIVTAGTVMTDEDMCTCTDSAVQHWSLSFSLNR